MRRGSIRMQRLTRFVGLAALVAASTSCGSVARDGRAPVYLVIDRLEGIRGAAGGASSPSATLVSDVLTLVTTGGTCSLQAPCPTFFGDNGVVTLHAPLKDDATTTTPSAPTT